MHYLAILLLLIGTVTILPASAHAEPTDTQAASATPDSPPNIPKPLKVLPSKIKPITSGADELSKAAPETSGTTSPADSHDHTALETLSPRENFGFSPDFWAGATRQDIIAFLDAPYNISSSRNVRDLNLRVTLTLAPSLAAQSTTPAENLYALRLKKLVALGAYDDAQKLYKMNESAPPTPLAAVSGIEAMLGHGEIAVACLEQNALSPDLKTETPVFWGNLDLFCKTLLNHAAPPTTPPPKTKASKTSTSNANNDTRNEAHLAAAAQGYLDAQHLTIPQNANADDINALDSVSSIAFLKAGTLHTALQSPSVLAALTDHQLALILAYAQPTPEFAPTLAEGLRRGVITDTSALDLLKSMAKTADKTNPVTPFLKEYFKTETPLLTAKLLELADTPTKTALLIPLYAQNNPVFPESNKRRSILILLAANQPLPLNLVRSAFPNVEDSLPENERLKETGESFLFSALIQSLPPVKYADRTGINPFLEAIAASISPEYEQKNAKTAYDNIFNLTPSGNYVMPMGDVLSSLKKSADQKQIYQVVIGSLSIINDIPPEKLHPASLYRVLEALNSVGFNEETLSLARNVLRMVLEK